MATALHNLSEYDFSKIPDASNMCFGIVVAEWNPEITGALLDGAVKTLEKHGAIPENIHVKTVPGSFELIYGAHQMVLNGGYDAVIILGSVIRGETPHFDYICEGVTYGIARLNATQEIPVIYGLLTTNDLQQVQLLAVMGQRQRTLTQLAVCGAPAGSTPGMGGTHPGAVQ